MIAALHDAITGRRGFPVFLTLAIAVFWLLRVVYPDAPSNDDVKEQLWMSADWRLGYGSGANPPMFTWLVKTVDAILGRTIVSVEIVRFALLWLFCFLSASTLRGMTGDGRLAALAGLAPFAVYAVGWEALFRHTNTMLLMASIPLTLAALQRLDRRGDWAGYLAVGGAAAVGLYAKYNYAIVLVGFAAAALMDGRLRARLLHRRMIIALATALLLLAPLFYWNGGHLDGMLGHGRLRLEQQPNYPALPAALSALTDLAVSAAGLVVPLFALLLAFCPRAFLKMRDAGDTERARWRRLLRHYLVVVVAVLVAGVFVLGMARFQTRYVYILLPVLPLAFLRVAAVGLGGRRRQWLAAALVVVILLVIAVAALRSATYDARKAQVAALPPAGRHVNDLLTRSADAGARKFRVLTWIQSR